MKVKDCAYSSHKAEKKGMGGKLSHGKRAGKGGAGSGGPKVPKPAGMVGGGSGMLNYRKG